MINDKTNYVEGRRIDDAWRDVMWLCIRNGYDFVVKGGSYVGQIRRQLPFVTIRITEPWQRPLAPIMPEGVGIPPPTSEEKIEKYFYEYLWEDELKENEQYTYGSFAKPQLPKIIDLLVKTKGNTNQACISVGDRNSVNLSDPPCLRVVSFKVVEGKLTLTVFFRSWDLFSGLPENLGGLQIYKEAVLAILQYHKLEIADGELIAYSDGLHIYEQYFGLADSLNLDKIKPNKKVLQEKEKFYQNLKNE